LQAVLPSMAEGAAVAQRADVFVGMHGANLQVTRVPDRRLLLHHLLLAVSLLSCDIWRQAF
jgi:hypothetical protein